LEGKEFNSINVIPLVDIMLVLLTIVLTTATFVVQGEIRVDLPEAEEAQGREAGEEVVISIDREGRIYLGGRLVGVEGLRKELSLLGEGSRVSLRADRDARIETFVEVMEVLNSLNLRDLRMIVERK